MSNKDHLKRQISKYRDVLANLSRRNRELYFKESKSSTINLSKQIFSQNMFREGVTHSFLPLRSLDNSIEKLIAKSEVNISRHFQMSEIRDVENLRKIQSRLDKIRLADDRHQKEYGISGAWILGPFLCWRKTAHCPKDDLLITPIFKIAIDLKRNKQKEMVAEVEDDSYTFNPSLGLALKQFLGASVPENIKFDTPSDGVQYLLKLLESINRNIRLPQTKYQSVPKIPGKSKIIKDEDGNETRIPIKLEDVLSDWELEIYETVTSTSFVLIDVLYLDQLNASRMVLYNDYEGILEHGLEHPILNELLNGIPQPTSKIEDRSKLKELDSYRERENHFVVDIDSTQHRAIDSATKSRAVVIQGPPGTGKSQTIVNLIADYLAKGKKVLFVSEKRPALDVVFNRMRSAKIDNQAVLIHSSDLNKADLYKTFLELTNSEPSSLEEKEWNFASSQLDSLKIEMNQYADTISTIHKFSDITFAEIIHLSTDKKMENFDPHIFQTFSQTEYKHLSIIGKYLDDLQAITLNYPNLSKSPWVDRQPDIVKSLSLEYFLQETKKNLQILSDNIQKSKIKFKEITDRDYDEADSSFWIKYPTPEKVNQDLELLWINKTSPICEEISKIKDQFALEISTVEENYRDFNSINPSSDFQTIEDLERYYSFPRGFSDWFTSNFWSYRKKRQHVCPQWDGTNKQFIGFKRYHSSIRKIREETIKIFRIDHSKIESHENIITSIRKCLSQLDSLSKVTSDLKSTLPLKLTNNLEKSLESFNFTIESIKSAKECCLEISRLESTYSSKILELSKVLKTIPNFDRPSEAEEFTDHLISHIGELEALDRIDILISRLMAQYPLSSLRSTILERFSVHSEKWSQVLETSCILGWIDEIYASSSELRSFDRQRVIDRRKELNTAFHNHQISSRQAVHQAFSKIWNSMPRNETAIGLLKKESSKQRKILSPREIMERGALKTMLDLKPCWLMSPLSISQMLPLTSSLFDVIIFDEASQVRVEDAIPSIFRAKTLVVVGDPKQMPPTNFFSGNTVDDDDEEDEPLSPSVLDLAAQIYPSTLLEWHYRSRSEALIAFSNRAYYGGRLIAAPNPHVLTGGGALTFRRIENAYFESRSGNRVEAEAVIDHLLELIKEDHERSYGVIAMGQAQANALDEALNRRTSENPKERELIEKSMSLKDGEADVGLFIKNLENVQGDERDIILLSVGYAAPSAGKKLRMNFGPLGKQGGGRRLNVAITRAKSKMYVYASFSPTEVATDEESFGRNPDLCVFGRYLKYVQAVSENHSDEALAILDSFPIGGAITSRKSSRFALDVKRRLEEIGYKVSTEIGSSGFYIDLGIHHPTITSNFCLGIECDGAIFHSTPYARDRDKIREQLLTSRGWNIERVWSQDWSKNWRKEVDRIKDRIENLLGTDLSETNRRKASGG